MQFQIWTYHLQSTSHERLSAEPLQKTLMRYGKDVARNGMRASCRNDKGLFVCIVCYWYHPHAFSIEPKNSTFQGPFSAVSMSILLLKAILAGFVKLCKIISTDLPLQYSRLLHMLKTCCTIVFKISTSIRQISNKINRCVQIFVKCLSDLFYNQVQIF